MRESRVENYFVRRVKRTGGEVRKVAWLGHRHAPDRMALWPALGRHHLVELKAPGKKPNPGQLREHERLRAAGFRVFWLDTKEGIDTYFTAWGW